MKVLRIGPTYIAFSVVGANYEEVEEEYHAKLREFFPDLDDVTVSSVEVVPDNSFDTIGEEPKWRAHVEAYAHTYKRPERASK